MAGRDILEAVDGLIAQATTEHSHYYTAAVLKEARHEIERLRSSTTSGSEPEDGPRCPECGGPVLISSGGPICVDHEVLIGHASPPSQDVEALREALEKRRTGE